VNISRKTRFAIYAAVIICVALASGFFGVAVGRQYQLNTLCCRVPRYRKIVLSVKETLGLVSFPSQIGQDKWVSETIFPGVTDGFFLDVGSGDGVVGSNTLVLERKGWKGICIDPFPKNMEGRTCRMFKDVVYSESGKLVKFHTAGDVGGIADTLGIWKSVAEQSPVVEFTTVTLGEILDRAQAPQFIHFMSLDIEGAELDALRGLPLDRYKLGALAVEHNWEGPKRSLIQELLEQHGYKLVHTWQQDDFYVPRDFRVPR
jgi:FkbM family methyltransferase